MIQINDCDYKRLLESRNAMAAALRRLADVSEATARQGDDEVPEHLRNLTERDLANAVGVARGLLETYGEHQAFILLEQTEPRSIFRRLLSS